MADNVSVVAGAATYDASTDDCGAAGQVQRVKLAYGANGDGTQVPADGDGLLVNLGANNDVTISGTVTVGSHAVTNAGTFAVQVTSAPSTAVTNAGTFAVQSTPPVATTATLANVAGATSSTTLQASNSARLGLVIVNDSTATLYVKFGSSASSTSYTVQLQAGETYVLPTQGCRYTGIVTGIWASATGNARMTELTA
jgi:uncharacterized membrane protein